MDPATARAIDEALKNVFQASLRTRLNQALSKIRPRASMRRVEHLVGLSEGYLSKVSNSRSDPSAELVTYLGLIAMNPVERLRDLEKLRKQSLKKTPSTSRKTARATKGVSNDCRP
jgi:hypothetical protein